MAIDKGLALVSVADVLFFNTTTGDYIGEGLALTNSTITQEMDSIEHRGGYLNALLFDIKHSKNLTVELESATFKMEYLMMQEGRAIVTGQDGVFKFDECVTFTNGVGSTVETPTGSVFVRMPNGIVKKITPNEKEINISDATFNGQLQVIYQYNDTVDKITIDTKTQPMTVKAVMRIHVLTQDGVEGFLQITIPRLKFDGSVTFDMAADSVSTFNLNGTAQEYATECGEAKYADVEYIKNGVSEDIAVEAVVASPNVIELSLAGTKTATANVIGVRSLPYSNVILDNSKVTFASATTSTATVDKSGVITAKAIGNTTITATYQGLQDIISVTVKA